MEFRGNLDDLGADYEEDQNDVQNKEGISKKELSDDETSNHSGEPDENVGATDATDMEDGVAFEPIELSARDRALTADVEGTVKMLDMTKGFGFLAAKLPEEYKKGDVFFLFDRVRNVGRERFLLKKGSRVSGEFIWFSA